MDVEAIGQGGPNAYNFDSSINDIENMKSNSVSQTDINKSSAMDDKNKIDGVNSKDAKKAAEVVNRLLENKSVHIEYEQDSDFKYIMIMKVVDNDTNQVINEIPSKKILDMVAQFCEMAGLIVNKKA